MARLAFLGSPEAAVPSLLGLVEAGHDVRLVLSQPDRRRGRGTTLTPSPVKKAAVEAGLSVTERMEDLVGSEAEIGIVVAYGRIVPRHVLDVLPMLNAHFSLLPRWRGAAPVERAILAGDDFTGVSIMRLEAGLDTGPVLKVRAEQIDNMGREHASNLTRRLAGVAAELLVEVLSAGAAAVGPGKEQTGPVTYAPKIDPTELHLDFSRTATELERVVRLDRAWTTFRGERLLVLDAVARGLGDYDASGDGWSQALSSRSAAEDPPGTLRDTEVQAADGVLELLVVQPAGRRPQPASEWVRGARIASGELLGG